MAAREPDVEEGSDVMDGDAGGLQDGPPHAHLPVLHAHRTHLASGRTVKLGTCCICKYDCLLASRMSFSSSCNDVEST